MSRLHKILETGAEPAPRHVRRKAGIVVVALVAALTGWAVVKNAATGDVAELEISAGLDDLAAGVRGADQGAFVAAEDHFVDAASVSVLDRYPAFLISTTRKIASPGDDSFHDELARLVAQRDFDAARRRLDELQTESPDAVAYWRRFLDDLELRLDQ